MAVTYMMSERDINVLVALCSTIDPDNFIVDEAKAMIYRCRTMTETAKRGEEFRFIISGKPVS